MGQHLSKVSRIPPRVVSKRTRPAPIEKLPAEVVYKIMESVGLDDWCAVVRVNKHFNRILSGQYFPILLSMIRSRPELDTLLRVCVACESDLDPERMLKPLSITFNFDPFNKPDEKIYLTRGPETLEDGKVIKPREIMLTKLDILRVALMVQDIDWWVEKYPDLRWKSDLEHRKSLLPAEEIRLRMAIARLWLYDRYFHGHFPRNKFCPMKFAKDARLHHLRILTTQEIFKLDHFLRTLRDAVSSNICTAHRFLSPGSITAYGHAQAPWAQAILPVRLNDRHPQIVSTYLKLEPDFLRRCLEEASKAEIDQYRLIQTVSLFTTNFRSDQESLSMSIKIVLKERLIMNLESQPKKLPLMGITVDDRGSPEECAAWNNDAWPTGYPPITREQLNNQPFQVRWYLPEGDDGSDHFRYTPRRLPWYPLYYL